MENGHEVARPFALCVSVTLVDKQGTLTNITWCRLNA